MLFGFAMITGGPKAAFANWTMIGGYEVLSLGRWPVRLTVAALTLC